MAIPLNSKTNSKADDRIWRAKCKEGEIVVPTKGFQLVPCGYAQLMRSSKGWIVTHTKLPLEGKRMVVLVEENYEDLELWYPVLRLKEAGATVTIVGPESNKVYRSKHGYPATADESVEAIAVDDFDGLIIPGGYAPDRMRRHEKMVSLVRQAMKADKIVAAICHAGWMLCSADVLDGREATSFMSIKDDMKHAGAKWIDQAVVHDGNLITSRTPDDLPAFLRTIIAACQNHSQAAMVAERAHYAG